MPFFFPLAGAFFATLWAGVASLFSRFTLVWIYAGLSVLGPVVQKIISFIGLATVVLVGINQATSIMTDYIAGMYGGLPADVSALIGLMKLDVGLSLIISAGVIKRLFSGYTQGSKVAKPWRVPSGVESPYNGSGRTF